VFPRDKEIEKVLDVASRYIRVITANASFGFPGYQPTGGLTVAEGVDAQAWAIWAAIAYDIEPSYISPLPGGGLRAQRLRAPGDTLRYKRGTCVDLALLFAACLEYVEIYPVIFLLEGHAYAGFWRDHDAYARFCRVELAEDFNVDLLEHSIPVTPAAWVVSGTALREVRRQIAEGQLQAVETQLLAERASLRAATLKAKERTKEITAVVDIMLARAQGVSSLPLRE
jgi:hypothetical protein